VNGTRGRRPIRGAALPLLFMMICTVALAPIGAAELPDGKGRETFENVCKSCHGLDLALQMRRTRGGWIKIVQSMKDMGADATPAQFNEIIGYLTQHFGESTAKESPQGNKTIAAASLSTAETETPPFRRALPWNKHPLSIGRALYRENCIVCHDIDAENSKKLGPSFYQLFQREQMPRAKLKPSRSYVATKIRAGGSVMPAFGTKLTPSEINALIDYLESR
jgi:mono/diheme cytochrome c family protein